MFQNPGFIQTNKQANKLTSKLPRPMLIAVGSSKGNIFLGIRTNFGSRFVSGILNHCLSHRPQAQGRIPRPTPPLPGEARLRQRRPRPRPRQREPGWVGVLPAAAKYKIKADIIEGIQLKAAKTFQVSSAFLRVLENR